MMEQFAQVGYQLGMELTTGQIGILSIFFLVALAWFAKEYFVEKDPQVRQLFEWNNVLYVVAFTFLLNSAQIPVIGTMITPLINSIIYAYTTVLIVHFLTKIREAGK